ncbi:MAG TPA: AAA family ATPase [Flavobacterium sp.]|nr:AAA family ATPase [Flavobacterium sp.]
MRLIDLAHADGLSLGSLQSFIFDFGIDINQVVDTNFQLQSGFIDFVNKHKDFLIKYCKDHGKPKTINDISKTIGVTPEAIIDFFQQNGLQNIDAEKFQTTVSSYLIHIYLGGNYDFIYEELDKIAHATPKTIVGYSDLFFYVADLLEPFITPNQLSQWGISKPSGMILYGPPGSGKVFWAKKIADLIGYEFVHLYQDYFSIKNNGNGKSQFNEFLAKKLKEPRTLLFIENFDEIMSVDKDRMSLQAINMINAVARHIQKNVHSEVVVVGSAEVISAVNEEITAPGRFDLHIPIFPPTEDERAELILHHMTDQLDDNSPLLHILKENKADNKDFWGGIAAQTKLFSNTMLIDFTQALKKRIYSLYRKNDRQEIVITEQLMMIAYTEARAKLTSHYLTQCAKFVMDAKQNVGTDFPHRFLEMEMEFDFYKVKKEPTRKIGFKSSTEDEDVQENKPEIDENTED